MGIEQHLDLDVTSALHVPLEDEAIVAERPMRLAPRRGEGVEEAGRFADDAHPLATATGRWLDEQWEPETPRGSEERGVRLVRVVIAGEHRDSERHRQSAGRGLVAHRPDGVGRRPDPADARGDDPFGEVGTLREEPEARVDRIGLARGRGGHDGLGVEEVERARSVGLRDDRADPEAVARALRCAWRSPRGSR